MKKEIRKMVIGLRDLQSVEVKSKYDSIIFSRVLDNKDITGAKTIFIFISFKSEGETIYLIERLLNRGHTVCVPRLEGKDMKAIEISSLDNLEETKYALEPKTGKEVEIRDIDVILVPGIAFDRKGNRIGYGGGYYDKFMKEIRKDCKKIALAYELQILDTIPVDKWDVKIDSLITEKDIYIFKGKE